MGSRAAPPGPAPPPHPLPPQFVSVEELVMALAEDQRFVAGLLKGEGVTPAQLEEAIMEVRGGKT